jgi:integrase
MRDASTGERKRKWHSFRGTKREAQIECARLVAELNRGTYLEPAKTTVAEFLERWLESIKANVAPRTHERYAEIVRKNIVPLTGAVVLSKLKPAQISEAYSKALSEGRRDGTGGLSPLTVLHMHRVLRRALKQAVRWEMLHRNPTDAVEPPKVEKRRMTTYDMASRPHCSKLLRGRESTSRCCWQFSAVSAVAKLQLSDGTTSIWRSAASLWWRAPNIMNGSVRLKETKSGRVRTVALPLMVRDELKAHRLTQAQHMLKLGMRIGDDSFVCALEDGSLMQPTFITHEWVRAIKGTALPRYRFHDLRHAHGTHMLASGTHIKVASERLGHSKVGITLDLYSHVLPGMQEDAAAKIDAAFRAAQDAGKTA